MGDRLKTFFGFTIALSLILIIAYIWCPSIYILKLICTCVIIVLFGFLMYNNEGGGKCKNLK